MAEHFETEIEKKITKTYNKFCKMLDFNTAPEVLDLFDFDKIFNILTNLNSVAIEITETIDEGYKDFKRGELLLVKSLIDLMYLHFHLSNQITVVANYIDSHFTEDGYPINDTEE